MATQIGPKIGIQGEKEYRAALKSIIDETKTLDSAMKKTASEWDKNTSSMTKNNAVAKNLTQQIDAQKQKLEIMNHMLEESAAKYGESAAATQSWQRAIDNTTASLNHMQNELKSLKGAENFSSLSMQLADAGQKLQNIGQSMTSVGQKLTTSLTVPLAAIGAAAINFGSDFEESANKVDVVFGNMSGSVREFASTTTDAFAISEGKALAMAGDYGAMATSMGMSQREAAKLSTEMVALAGDMSSFHNKSIDIASNSLKGVFTGETEALKQFGVAMTQTNLEEFAAKQGKVYSSMTQGEKIMVRYQYLLDSQKDAIGDAGRTMDGFAGSTRQMRAAFEDAAAALGQALIPVITPIVQAITKLLKAFTNLPEPIQSVIGVVLVLAAAIGPIVLIMGAFTSAIGSIASAAPAVITAITGMAAAFTGLDLAIAPAIAVLIGLAAVCALAFAAGWQLGKSWDSIAEAASNMGSKIKDAFNNVEAGRKQFIDGLAGIGDAIVEKFKELPKRIADALKQAIDEIKNIFKQMIENAKKSGKDMIDGFVDGIQQRISKVINAVKKVAQTVKDFLGFSEPDKGPLSDFHTFAPDMMKLFAQGIYQNKGMVTRAIDSLAKDIALPLDSSASMNVALAGADGSSMSVGGTTMNVYVDHINDLQDLIRIQNQAQQRYRMGAR